MFKEQPRKSRKGLIVSLCSLAAAVTLGLTESYLSSKAFVQDSEERLASAGKVYRRGDRAEAEEMLQELSRRIDERAEADADRDALFVWPMDKQIASLRQRMTPVHLSGLQMPELPRTLTIPSSSDAYREDRAPYSN